jgi:hypothetical protein
MVALVEQQGGVYCPDVLSAFYRLNKIWQKDRGPLQRPTVLLHLRDCGIHTSAPFFNQPLHE